MSESLVNQIKLDALKIGIDTFGICNIEQLQEVHPDLLSEIPVSFTRALVFGLPLPAASLDGVTDKPNLLYFHHYRQLNYILDRFTTQTAIKLEQAGVRALAVPATQIISWKPVPRGHISHKLLGAAAGLGWRGRNNLLVTPRHGARIRFGSVLCDLPLDISNSPVESRCNSCRECIPVCPAGAIKENPADFDLEACAQKLKEFSKIPFIGQQICGICVKACKPIEPAGR